MNRFAFGLLALALVASAASAGPFRRRAVVNSCPNGNCQVQQTVTKTQTTTTTTVTANNSTAQGVALLIVQTGRFRHFGGYNGLEGIGLGATPEQAEFNCCFRRTHTPRERGFAQLANGMWACCCRY
jgi:hypothetical protein